MNPRQRRGAVLLILAALGAVAVFLSIVSYVGSIRAEVGPKTDVLVLTRNVPAYAPVDPDAVRREQVPGKWIPQAMLRNLGDLTGKVAAADLDRGAFLQRGMLIDAPSLQEGEREIAILVDAETGVADKVHANSLTDIYASFEQQQQRNQQPCAIRVIAGARVIQVGRRTVTERAGPRGTEAGEAIPVTFALTPQESLRLTYAESFAAKVRLALIGDGQSGLAASVGPVCRPSTARSARNR
jgi:pilus assembly protein CpaB